MYQDGRAMSRPVSFYQGFFGMAFQAADVFSVWWQPVMKGIGRSQLELASLQSRNTRAALEWGREIGSAQSLTDVMAAHTRYMEAILVNFGDTVPKVSGALSQAVQPPAAFQLLPLPFRQQRDTLVIPGFETVDQASEAALRVA